MDGYASNSSSMVQNGLKVSLYNDCPIAIIADLDIMKNAPMRMLMAGLGDVLAKCVAIADWRIANIVVGEAYCEALADLMRYCVKKCLDSAQGLVQRDPEAVKGVVEGLVLSGVAMSFAGSSRPASGLETLFLAHVGNGDAAAACRNRTARHTGRRRHLPVLAVVPTSVNSKPRQGFCA